jgi:hypothetical protein
VYLSIKQIWTMERVPRRPTLFRAHTVPNLARFRPTQPLTRVRTERGHQIEARLDELSRPCHPVFLRGSATSLRRELAASSSTPRYWTSTSQSGMACTTYQSLHRCSDLNLQFQLFMPFLGFFLGCFPVLPAPFAHPSAAIHAEPSSGPSSSTPPLPRPLESAVFNCFFVLVDGGEVFLGFLGGSCLCVSAMPWFVGQGSVQFV